MSFKKPKAPPATVQTSSTFKMSPQQEALINPVVAAGQKYVAAPPMMPSTSSVAGFDPLQTKAQDLLLGATLPQSALAGSAGQANQFLLGDVLDPSSNKYLRATIDAATRPIQQNFLESILPGIRSDFISAGQYGGSGQGVAEGIAARGAIDAAADASSRIASQGYTSGLEAMGRGLALTPQTLAGMLTPGMTTAAVGDERQNLQQAVLDESYTREMYNQLAPWMAAKEVAAVGAGLPGGTNMGTAPNPAYLDYQARQAAQPSMFQKLLGMGAMGLSLWNPTAGATLGGARAVANVFK